MTVDWVDCRCFLSFVFIGGARHLELSLCNTAQCNLMRMCVNSTQVSFPSRLTKLHPGGYCPTWTSVQGGEMVCEYIGMDIPEHRPLRTDQQRHGRARAQNFGMHCTCVRLAHPYQHGCVCVWHIRMHTVRAALLPAVGTCIVLSFGVMPGWCCFLRVTYIRMHTV